MRPRALVLRAIGLGDLLAGVPALRALRRGLPDHEVVLAAPAAQLPLVRLLRPGLDGLLPTEELAPVAWPGPAPDLAVDLHGNGPATKDLLLRLRPRRLVAFAGPDGQGSQVAGPDWDPDEHERVRWCRLVSTAFGVDADPTDLLLDVPVDEPLVRDAVVVHVGAAYPSRRWPEDRFAAVARWASEAGHPVVLTGSATELPAVERVRHAAGLGPDAVLAGRTDLGELAALVAHARLLVSGDTGTAHLASAYATPSVVLFGPTPPSRWGPPPGPHVALWHGDEPGRRPGDPHGAEPDPALLRITVPEVLAAAEPLVQPDVRRRARPSTARSA